MYDEDRETALSLYSELFDRTSDTEALITLLNSPTRQAVVLARSYNARERDLAVRGQSGKGDADVESGSVPDFVKVINKLTDEAEAKGILSSYVSAWSDTSANAPDEPEFPADALSASPSTGESPVVAPEPAPDAVAAPESSASADPASEPETAADTGCDGHQTGNQDLQTDSLQVPQEEKEPEFQMQAPESAPSPETAENNTGSDSNNAAETAPDSASRSETASKEEPDNGFGFEDKPESTSESAYDLYLRSTRNGSGGVTAPNGPAPVQSEKDSRELSVPLLILYILIAVPVTALLLILLLIPTAISLSLSVIMIVLGVQVAASAFSGFAVFADIMVVLGSALVLIAFGLLFFWLFIWLIGSVMVNLINSVIVLGEKVVMSGGDEE